MEDVLLCSVLAILDLSAVQIVIDKYFLGRKGGGVGGLVIAAGSLIAQAKDF